MSSIKIRIIIILSALTVLAIFFMQAYFLSQNINRQEAQFHQSVSIALRNTAKAIAKYNKVALPEKGLIIRESSNLYEVNVKSQIDQSILANTLETELDKQGLDLPFEYGIYDCATDELVYSDCCNYPNQKKSVVKKSKKSKKADENYYFVVRFPEKQSYVYQKMSNLIFFSALLLIACIIMASAIFIILRQKRYSDLMRDFVNNMTHEFKTPISSIKISSDVLLNDPRVEEDGRLRQYAQIIKDQNKRLNDQVEKVLQIAKMESSSFTLKRETISLHQLIQDLVDQNRLRIHDAGGKLDLDLKAEKNYVKVDKFHMINVLANLLDNAIKYSREKPLILIRTFNDWNHCVVEIKDNGIGIKKEELGKLFQKFYRVPTGDVHNVKGFGIGLYYVKRICEAQDIDLDIESEFGKGTTVRLIFKNIVK